MWSLARTALNRNVSSYCTRTLPARHISSFQRPNALTAFRAQAAPHNHVAMPNLMEPSTNSILNGPSAAFAPQQCRWKSLGNFFRPSTVRRKRKLGFLVRQRSRTGRRIVQRRRLKGRWYLTH